MLHGEDKFVLSSGTVVTVRWTRPEVGIDITKEEQEERMQKFAQAGYELMLGNCRREIEEGNVELADKRWHSFGFKCDPPWRTDPNWK